MMNNNLLVTYMGYIISNIEEVVPSKSKFGCLKRTALYATTEAHDLDK